ncbi:type IV pilus biogenesis protein PilM [Pseudomonas sp. AB12(2023)]|uniref:type IV pilus biogenesis protein PilM n=1 Tax=Pseudomonas sp. AB12(2023) TaxID=3048597 RepID=UPI002B221C72|nr:type IV pilus biogenesis protein PilM [Pseudomonas sp. AB12(2023)]MEB0221349.1 type IV pilus biogenesis protein PilM [Pseudomonas sp. AB12(2023)]
MPMIWVYLVVLIFSSYFLGENNKAALDTLTQGETQAIAKNMLLYKNAVAAFVDANPSTTGAIPDSSLALPSWFRTIQGVTNYVESGHVYIYAAGRPALASAIFSQTQALTVGINQSGRLVNPISGDTGIILPAVIPNLSVVTLR